MRIQFVAGCALASLLAVAGSASGQYTINTLTSFSYTAGAGGYSPVESPIVSGNTLYGVAGYNGSISQDEIYSLPIGGGTPSQVAYFTGTEAYPSGIIASGSSLYGTTYLGGANGDGEVFSLSTSGGAPTVLASFNGTNGKGANSGLISGTTFYGTTSSGGANGDGEVFSVPLTGGTPTVLASFNGTNGQGPNGDLVLSGGTLYGATGSGGYYGDGVVFSIPINGGTPTVLANFDGVDGNGPSGLVISGNTLYGTTYRGGLGGTGEVFSLPITGATGDGANVLAYFDGTDGNYPTGKLALLGNVLYGITYQGGSNGDGVVFSVPVGGASGYTPTVLASFDGANGENPTGDAVISGDTLYGATEAGGAESWGTVFSVDLPEPAALTLSALGCIAMLFRGRKLLR